MKRKLLLFVAIFSCIFMYSQSSDCLNAEPFCTGTSVSFPASTNTASPTGPYYDCLATQPNPAFYYLQIDQSGSITIDMQSTPLVDIDFICWGPFTDPNTMCDSLTAAYVEDCSYSAAATEICDITNAVVGQFYILLITNYSNQICDIDFSQIGGNGTTDCCILGDAGDDNINPGYITCNSAPSFIMEDELNGTPTNGGNWYDNSWNAVSNSFNPANGMSGTYSYIVLGTPPLGSTIACPDDTANLIININADPIINFPVFSEVCSDANAINLNSAIPSGGTYFGNGVNVGVFTPNVNVLGNNLISYSFTDLNGCSDTSVQPIIVHDVPLIDLGSDTNISCNSSYVLIPEIIGGTTPYSYLWSNGSTIGSQDLLDGNYYLLVTDFYGCSANDTIEVTYDVPPILDLGTDTTIACNSSYLLIPNITGGVAPYSYLWSNGSTLISQTLGEGDYDLIVTDFYGCEDNSSILITYDPPPVVDLGSDYTIACNTTTTLIPNVLGGTQPYTYEWNDGSENSNLSVAQGNYSITVTDFYGCLGSDVVDILEDAPGTVTLSGGTSICADGSFAEINFNFNGLFPWDLVFSNGLINQTIQQITDSNYLFTTSNDGIYNIVSAADANDCLANIVGTGTAQVIVHPLPVAIISPAEISIYEGDAIELEVGEYAMYQWFNAEGLLNLDTLSTLTVSDSGIFYVEVIDFNGCSDVSDDAIIYTKPYTNLFIPNAFTPNGDDHNELFVISGVNIKTFNIQIFNRWGELMFMSESIDKSWDGTFANKKVQEGSYYYNVKVLGDDKRMLESSGTVNIIY